MNLSISESQLQLPSFELSPNPERHDRLMQALQVLSEESVKLTNAEKMLGEDAIDLCIARLKTQFNKQLDAILHDPSFQELEGAWCALKRLVDTVEPDANIKLDILNVTKEELAADFIDSEKEQYSALYQHVYTQEYDTPGGEPYSLMTSNFAFGYQRADVDCLRSISRVAASAHCPFIASVSEKFFEQPSMSDVLKIQDLSSYLQGPEYKDWNALRREPDARYLGITLPKMVLRKPYDHESVEFRASFNWISASYAFTENMLKAFARDGWHINILGTDEGRINDLPYVEETCLRIPTETIVPETNEFNLSKLGFIPLSYFQNQSFACFFSASSLYQTSSNDPRSDAINARIPYILLSSRIAHYLKVLQRENIGKFKTATVLEEELNAWLNTLITRMNAPSAAIIAKHPLKDGRISVAESQNRPGFYDVAFYIVPHFQVEGLDIKLSLLSKLPK